MPAHVGLEYRLGDRDGEQIVLARLEVAELLGEDGERALDRGVDDDVVLDVRSSRLRHEASPSYLVRTMVCVVGQGLRPEPVQLGAQRLEAGRVELIDAPGSRRAVAHQPGALEHLEVLRNSRPADG